MSQQLILTLMADDQPGIVDQLSACVALHNGNWLESRLAQMAGKFAGIVRVECPDENVQALSEELATLSENGIRVTVEQGNHTDALDTQPITLTVTANDRPGIVQEVSHALAGLKVNVLNLNTRCESAPMSAGPMFVAEIEAEAASDFDQNDLIKELEKLSDDLMVDLY
jgi:glycine cleavage system regulatory protein